MFYVLGLLPAPDSDVMIQKTVDELGSLHVLILLCECVGSRCEEHLRLNGWDACVGTYAMSVQMVAGLGVGMLVRSPPNNTPYGQVETWTQYGRVVLAFIAVGN